MEQFLIHDSRFAVNGPEGAEDTSVIEIQGAQHASRRAIEARIRGRHGRSVYLLPLDGRRATLRTVDWVKDATVDAPVAESRAGARGRAQASGLRDAARVRATG